MRRHNGRFTASRFAFLVLASLLWTTPAARALECHVDTSAQNLVRFVSDAPIEDFDGKTRNIDGYVYWDGDSLTAESNYDGSELYFEVPLVTLRTGIGLRDRHMRENYLETDEHPYASYKGVIAGVEPDSAGGWIVHSEGELSIHGTTRNMQLDCRVTPHPGGFRVTSAFSVKLPDYQIEVPSLMFMKISEVIQLELVFYMKTIRSEK